MAHWGTTARDSVAGRRRAGLVLALVLLPVLGGCKVVPIAADRAARERLAGAFDASRYVDTVWEAQATPYWDKAAVPFPDLVAGTDRDLASAGAKDGRQAGDGSPWTFVTRGQGVVTAVDIGVRAGRIVVSSPAAGGSAHDVVVQIGPVVSGSTLRDSLPFVTFNDFSNQIAFAEVGGALSRRAVAGAKPVASQLKVGDPVTFVGTFALSRAGDPIVLTPVRLDRSPPRAQART